MIKMKLLWFHIIRADETVENIWCGRPSEYVRYDGKDVYHIIQYSIKKGKYYESKTLLKEKI